ncbi:MAG: hypothetical protein EBR82_55705 [Caulobacteraceae bacterium]|nr:hypothetical protein [Caulobacteraceae bacterium]
MSLAPILTLLLLLPTLGVRAEEAETTAEQAIASLTDPKKLATLKGERAVNPRFQKCIWYLSQRTINQDPAVVIDKAMELNKTAGTAYAKAVKQALMEGLYAHNKYGGVGSFEGGKEMMQGKSATITKGEYAGQEATADHIIPLSVCPELQNQIFNLQLLPASLNSSKGNKVEAGQLSFAEELNKGGLLSAEGLEAVKKAYEKEASAQPPQTAESEEEKQARMNEESRQMELELVRAERKGTEAVYEVWVERLKKLGEQANKSKASSDVLIFEKTLNSAMGIWERMFEENWNKNHPRPISGDYELKRTGYERARNQEVAHLESFLDESLRAK